MRSDDKLGMVVSTTDLLNYLSCEELTVLDLLKADGLVSPLPVDQQMLAAKKGLLSEEDVLAILEKRHGGAARIIGRDTDAFDTTVKAMREGKSLIYQGLLLREVDGLVYESRPDFLIRVEEPSSLGAYSYEPVDSKLSKTTKLDDLVQVLDYADALMEFQGVLPKRAHLFLAGVDQVSYRTESCIEEVRLQRRNFLRHVALSSSVSPEGLFPKLDPKPNSLCLLCTWQKSCEEYWEKSDSLYRVANITRSQVARLIKGGVTSMTQLAQSTSKEIEAEISSDVLSSLIAQADAQMRTMSSGSAKPYYRVRDDAAATALSRRGLGLLPKASEGDIFFDIEGDPFYKPDGLEYLFGVAFFEAGGLRFRAFWGTDPTEERRAFGELVDFMMRRWEHYPDLHIYHYADYERGALSKLASRSNFKVFEVDTILRNDLLVDLYPAVKGTLLLGSDSYSLKKVEKLYLKEGRSEAVTTAMGSVESFEAWLESRDDEILDEIERYNEMDVRSTAELRDFLLGIRNELCKEKGEFPYRGEEAGNQPEILRQKKDSEIELEGYEMTLYALADQSESKGDKEAFRLCGDLMGFFAREEKPNWWRYFNLISPERESHEFLSESGCIGGLQMVSQRLDAKGNALLTFKFDRSQAFKIGDEKLLDPELEYELHLDPEQKGLISFGTVARIDFARGEIEIKRDKKYPEGRTPKNLVAWSSVPTRPIEDALKRFADKLISSPSLTEATDVGIELLKVNRPRFRVDGRSCTGIKELSTSCGDGRDLETEELAIRASEALQNSYLVLQGPPGAGKTFLCAKVIAHLVGNGKKVFATALSHSAIDNLMEALAPMIDDPGSLYRVEGAKARKRDGITPIRPADLSSLVVRDHGLVVGGTIWNGSRPDLAGGFDYGFVDEAGQFSLANAIALTNSCRNLVLSGDPQQLSQPLIGSHPPGAGRSVLEHLMGQAEVVDPDHGIFLSKTYRMHPKLASVVSAISYDSQLHSSDGLDRLELLDHSPLPKNGLVYIPVEHSGNTYRSLEEVEVAKKVSEFLLGRSWIDKFGIERPVTPREILAVAPYNAQTNALSAALSGFAEVGTVDKFQGREAPFVILSLSASDGESSGRGVDFLFSTNRLNVAISRAKVMTVIVGSPALIETKPRTLDQLYLLGAVSKAISSATVVEPDAIP